MNTSIIFRENLEGLEKAQLTVHTALAARLVDLDFCHCRLSHVSKSVIRVSHKHVSRLPGMSGLSGKVLCEGCKVAKFTQNPRKIMKQSMARIALDREYSDELQPIEVMSFKVEK